MKINKSNWHEAVVNAKMHLDGGCIIDFISQENEGFRLFPNEDLFVVEVNREEGDGVEAYSFATDGEAVDFIDEVVCD